MCKIMIQSDHNFAHATTAQLSGHVQNYDQIGSLEYQLQMLKIRDFDHELVNFLWNVFPCYLFMAH